MQSQMAMLSPSGAVWITRPLRNADELAAWAKGVGFYHLRPEVWHVTVIKADPASPLDRSPLTIEPSINRSVIRLGELIALEFNSPRLQQQHTAHRRAGGLWEFPSFRAHVSFTPADHRDLKGIEPFGGALHFGPEAIDRWGG